MQAIHEARGLLTCKVKHFELPAFGINKKHTTQWFKVNDMQCTTCLVLYI